MENWILRKGLWENPENIEATKTQDKEYNQAKLNPKTEDLKWNFENIVQKSQDKDWKDQKHQQLFLFTPEHSTARLSMQTDNLKYDMDNRD